MIGLAKKLSRRLHVCQQVDLVANPLPVANVQLDPTWRAMAMMCGGQLVEPPIAELTTIAFSKASRVRTLLGVRSSLTISTILRPVWYAILALCA